jgi:hypothetical protein|tara:strand:+ start:899 stop:1174 length:276 start_codon:yes stop_codon:yes gene_type:complete
MVTSRNAQRGVLDNYKPEEAHTMKDIIHNTISVERGIHEEFCLYWQDGDGNHSEFICVVHGFENAIRVANGIAHEQVEFVKHPCFDPAEVA